MELPIPEVSHDLSIEIGSNTYKFVVIINAAYITNFYAIVLTLDMEDKFFGDFQIEPIFLNQFFPVQNVESAISNVKACKTNLEWVLEQSYRAFKEAAWTSEEDNEEE
tara:strand:+ start:38 stop:361 length:324 start_codon:yes stop_codon:yes gene_type:complete